MSALPFLEALIYGVRTVYNGATELVQKSKIQFRNGLTAQVIGDQIVVDATGGGGGSGAVPVNSGDSSTEVALDDVAVTGGRNLLVGTDSTLTKTYKFVTILATEAIDWSPTGTSVMAAYADSIRLHNGRPLMFLDATDNTTVPATGKLRFPYNSGAPVPILAVKDHTGTDRVLLMHGAGDLWTLGDSQYSAAIVAYDLQITTGVAASSWTYASTLTFTSAAGTALVLGANGAVYAMRGEGHHLTEQHAPYTLVAGQDFSIVALDAAGTYTLPASGALSDGDTFEICNMSGGNITVAKDGGGPNIYGVGASETLVDGETATYRYNSGAVSTTPFWIRVS